MKNAREILAVMGEFLSHVYQVEKEENILMMKALALRYLLIEIGIMWERLCVERYGNLSNCIKRAEELVGGDFANNLDEILRLRKILIDGGEVDDQYVERVLRDFIDMYVEIERKLLHDIEEKYNQKINT